MFRGTYTASNRGLRSRPLAHQLWNHGYRTAAITGGGQVDARFGFQTGFEAYQVDYWLYSVDQVADWLEAGRRRKDFLFLHTFEIHDPYTDQRFVRGMPAGRIRDRFSVREHWSWRNEMSPEEKAYAEALYDGDIAFTDERLGELFDELERRGLLERSIVIVTSDHGEQFWEHGNWRHGSSMYDHQLLVPLIMHLPEPLRRQLGVPHGQVIDQQVELVDLYPTILDLLGIELDHEVQGLSLRPLLAGGTLPFRQAFAENTNIKTWERKALRTDRYKFVYSYPKKRSRSGNSEYYQLYDLIEDPLEQVNLADDFPDLVRAHLEKIRALRRGVGAEQLDEELPEGLDPDLEEKLKALGYIGN